MLDAAHHHDLAVFSGQVPARQSRTITMPQWYMSYGCWMAAHCQEMWGLQQSSRCPWSLRHRQLDLLCKQIFYYAMPAEETMRRLHKVSLLAIAR